MLVVYSDCISIEHCDYLLFVCVFYLKKRISTFQNQSFSLDLYFYPDLYHYFDAKFGEYSLTVNLFRHTKLRVLSFQLYCMPMSLCLYVLPFALFYTSFQWVRFIQTFDVKIDMSVTQLCTRKFEHSL